MALKPPPEPRLGAGGTYLPDDPNAGYLSVQGRAGRGGAQGLFDDVVGPGWQLLVRTSGFPLVLDEHTLSTLRDLRVVVADFGPSGDTLDLDGVYAAWFDRLGADAVLVRPDLYGFGTSSLTGVAELLAAAHDKVGLPA